MTENNEHDHVPHKTETKEPGYAHILGFAGLLAILGIVFGLTSRANAPKPETVALTETVIREDDEYAVDDSSDTFAATVTGETTDTVPEIVEDAETLETVQ